MVGEGIIISSEFDSGNLSRCSVSDENSNFINCWMSGDGLPYTNVGHYKSWFYFSIKGMKNESTYTFCMRNMGLQSKLYKMGLRPVFRVSPTNMNWRRCNGPIQWGMNEENTSF